MNIEAAAHCYQVARAAGNRVAALNHLRRIRDELRARRTTNKKQISNCDRVQSLFDCG